MYTAEKMFQIDNPRQQIKWLAFWLSLSALIFIIWLYFGWQYWGSNGLVNDDIHREFITPLRLLQGEVLYRDFNFVYGPLPPYLNSWVVSLCTFNQFTALRLSSATLFFLQILGLWLICRELGISWVIGPVIFGLVSWGWPYLFNPTSFNSLYVGVLGNLGIWCAIKTLKRNKWPWFFLGAAFAGALLSKPEGVFILGLAFLAAFIMSFRLYRKNIFAAYLYFVLGVILILAPFIAFLLKQGLSWPNIIEGILQLRFQRRLSEGFIAQYNYFFGINHILVITAGCIFIALIFHLLKLYLSQRRLAFWVLFFAISGAAAFWAEKGQLIRVLNDYQNLGDFFGGILGYWWYKGLPEGSAKKGFFIFWLSSLGGWLRPLFHIGALVIPFQVGGGMLLAVIFWFLILPKLFKATHHSLIKQSSIRINRVFIKMGMLEVLCFGAVGILLSVNTQLGHPFKKFNTPYGSFTVNAEDQSTRVGVEARDWLKKRLNGNKRLAALEGLPIELNLGYLPCLPLSELNYQIYDNDWQRIIRILEERQDIGYVLVHLGQGGYHFGVQDYKLADYLDNHWKQEMRFGVPASLNKLSEMSSERKKDVGLISGFIIYGRR